MVHIKIMDTGMVEHGVESMERQVIGFGMLHAGMSGNIKRFVKNPSIMLL